MECSIFRGMLQSISLPSNEAQHNAAKVFYLSEASVAPWRLLWLRLQQRRAPTWQPASHY